MKRLIDQYHPSLTDVPTEDTILRQELFLTPRQKRMLWYLNHLGIIGLAQCLIDIVREDDKDDVEMRDMDAKRTTALANGVPKRKRIPKKTPVKNKKRKNDATLIIISDTEESQDEQELQADQAEDLQGHSIWQSLIDDYKKGAASTMMYHLASMPTSLIKALICGDLPHQMQDLSFRQKINNRVRLRNTPGVYAVFVSSCKPGVDYGSGPTLKQLLKVSETMRRYCNRSVTDSAELAIKIDAMYGDGKLLDYKFQRRYAGGAFSDNVAPLILWLDQLDEFILNHARALIGTLQEPLLEKPMKRSFPYIGLSKQVLRRALGHSSHTGSSCIFGLYTATLRYLYQDQFDTVSFSYQIIHTADPEKIGFDEILVTLLASGHWWDGGLNRTHSGTNTGRQKIPTNQVQRLVDNDRINYDSESISTTIADSITKISQTNDHLSKVTADNSQSLHNIQLSATMMYHRDREISKRLERLDILNDIQTFKDLSSNLIKHRQKVLTESYHHK